MTTPLDSSPQLVLRIASTSRLEVMHLRDGRKLLLLPVGRSGRETWYELSPAQAQWLAQELASPYEATPFDQEGTNHDAQATP